MNVLLRILEMPMGPALLAIGLVAVWFLADIRRLLSDYPPHRHVGKEVVYPKGMAPEKPQELEQASKASA